MRVISSDPRGMQRRQFPIYKLKRMNDKEIFRIKKTDYYQLWVFDKTDSRISTKRKRIEIIRIKQFETKKKRHIFCMESHLNLRFQSL